ncbi:hypothetical protein SAMN05443429_10847 [Cruoricaptor ignavus]|uniref:Uncharacterized protein n=1 Tax=Cruoricaptor ignavus TaxID=1118202 RepID=A0A1M6G3Z3_9FLAO|nr:hypothetical protein [Cruoricaptor ignavus]QOR74461.1 hypothetical protein IMZ16_03220 [Cruoricaptor ignavus]SHJ04698.1 hypothetical protein SAMN05443429_10847 [Cruoricaptor ignavus]
MFFFIAGNSSKLAGQETVRINRNGQEVNAEVRVFKNYISVFFIPLIPTGRRYSIYIPHTGEYYEQGAFSSMPPDLLEVCREVGRRY